MSRESSWEDINALIQREARVGELVIFGRVLRNSVTGFFEEWNAGFFSDMNVRDMNDA